MTIRNNTHLRGFRLDPDLDGTLNVSCQVRISQQAEDPDWDAFLAETPGGHHVQSSLWARVKAGLGWGSTRVVVTQEEQIVAGAQILVRQLPLIGTVGYVPKGPLLARDDPVLTELVINKLQQVAKTQHIHYLAVQPPHNGEIIAQQLPRWGFRPSSVEVAPTATILIDLTLDLDDILAQMRKKTRQSIRQGLREGITVREGTESDLPTFYRLLVATSQRRKFSPYPEQYFSEMWRVFSPHGCVKLFLAEYRNETVSALLVIPFADTVIFKTGGWSGRQGNHHPNEVLRWSVIRWAKSHGYQYCDLEGIAPKAARVLVRGEPLPESLMKTPTFFKLGFGGQVTLFPTAYDYIYNPFFHWAYSTVFPKIAHWPVVASALNQFRVR
jgi:peptidoglycan pentaglycine glycine transferase (the first glycine)